MKSRAYVSNRKVTTGALLMRLDPTRTSMLIRLFAVDVSRQWRAAQIAVTNLIVNEDALGLAAPVSNVRWKAQNTSGKIDSFGKWLKYLLGATVTNPTEQQAWTKYITTGFTKGAAKSYTDVMASPKYKGKAASPASPKPTLDWLKGNKDGFLQAAMGNPVVAAKVKLLTNRAFTDLQGITVDTSLRMSRVLTDGLLRGYNPKKIASELVKQLGLGKDRALLIARTEIIRAHAEGQLASMRAMGVGKVGASVEFTVAHAGVCPKCASLDGAVYTLDQASGIIPVHPRCRCAWFPVVD